MNLKNRAEIYLHKKHLKNQSHHWEHTFSSRPNMFGNSPSFAAKKAFEIFKKAGLTNILELGCGQGRDTLFFAKSGLYVHALDYSQTGVDSAIKKAKTLGLSQNITAKVHDIRKPLPFKEESFDLILLDEMMTGMDGLETLKLIKELQPDIPIIMITKNEEEWLMEEAIGSQISNYLTKPVNPSQVLMACKNILEVKKIQDDKLMNNFIKYLKDISMDNFIFTLSLVMSSFLSFFLIQ